MTISTNRLIPKLADLSRRPYFSNRGFIQLPLMGWVGVGVGVLVLMLSGALWIQSKRLSNEQEGHAQTKAEYAAFAALTAAMGRAAKEKAEKQEAADKARKEKADELHARAVATLNDRITRLRRERDSTPKRIVPPAPTTTSRPELACFDRPELERSIRGDLDAVRGEIRQLADEGSKATIELDGVKRWAQ